MEERGLRIRHQDETKRIEIAAGHMTTARDRGCPALAVTRVIRRERLEAGSLRSSRTPQLKGRLRRHGNWRALDGWQNHHRGSSYRGDVLWLGPFSVPNWAVIGFVLVILFPLGIVLSVKRMRLESPWHTRPGWL
jgi:hypothetical protein